VPHLRVAGDAGPEGLVPTTDRFGTALADIVRCLDCTHRQLERLPHATELADAYREAASDEYVVEEAGQRETARRILDRIERHARRGAFLDLGCWVGFQLAEARDRGWRAVGVEPSAFAHAYATETLGLDVERAELDAIALPQDEFDAVLLGDVIEHLPDPGAALDRIADSLLPGGVLAIAAPDAGSRLARAMGGRWWSVIPTHVHYFTRRSIGTLLARYGFAPLSFETAPKSFSVRYYLGRIGGYSTPIADALVRAADAAGVADRPWAPDFRDRMLVIARAPEAAGATGSQS
jgi:SAM-dependent methyltransferase